MSSTGTQHPSGCKGGLVRVMPFTREWSDYSDDEPLPPVLEPLGSRTQDSNILHDGSPWIKIPMAVRRGKLGKTVTVWVTPIRAPAILSSLSDSGRDSSDSEYLPE
jgi:hypothetical protein